VEGNPVNALLAGVPDLIVTSVGFLVYAILFAVELKGLSETKSGQSQGLGKSHELPSLSQYRR
ncbi:MAG: hypothetical protein ACFFCP_12945, partial [Promethearchaeota archaeon]